MSDMSQAPQPAQAQAQPGAQDTGNDEADEVSVEICVNTKTGEVRYGLENDDPDTSEEDDEANYQSAKDLDDAFMKAKQLLQQAMSGQSGPDAGAQSSFEQGFSGVAGQGGASPY